MFDELISIKVTVILEMTVTYPTNFLTFENQQKM